MTWQDSRFNFHSCRLSWTYEIRKCFCWCNVLISEKDIWLLLKRFNVHSEADLTLVVLLKSGDFCWNPATFAETGDFSWNPVTFSYLVVISFAERGCNREWFSGEAKCFEARSVHVQRSSESLYPTQTAEQKAPFWEWIMKRKNNNQNVKWERGKLIIANKQELCRSWKSLHEYFEKFLCWHQQ